MNEVFEAFSEINTQLPAPGRRHSPRADPLWSSTSCLLAGPLSFSSSSQYWLQWTSRSSAGSKVITQFFNQIVFLLPGSTRYDWTLQKCLRFETKLIKFSKRLCRLYSSLCWTNYKLPDAVVLPWSWFCHEARQGSAGCWCLAPPHCHSHQSECDTVDLWPTAPQLDTPNRPLSRLPDSESRTSSPDGHKVRIVLLLSTGRKGSEIKTLQRGKQTWGSVSLLFIDIESELFSGTRSSVSSDTINQASQDVMYLSQRSPECTHVHVLFVAIAAEANSAAFTIQWHHCRRVDQAILGPRSQTVSTHRPLGTDRKSSLPPASATPHLVKPIMDNLFLLKLSNGKNELVLNIQFWVVTFDGVSDESSVEGQSAAMLFFSSKHCGSLTSWRQTHFKCFNIHQTQSSSA